jgi:shikimate 5-dehydrogenase
MHPRVDESPLPEAWLRGSLVYDIIYNPPETALLKLARQKGIPVLGGAGMFLGQAAAQFRLFTGVEPPLDAWRAVLAAGLDGRRSSLQGESPP